MKSANLLVQQVSSRIAGILPRFDGANKVPRTRSDGAVEWVDQSEFGGGASPYTSPPEDLGTADPGNASFYARGNHRHAHGNQTGGSLHAKAGATAGFLAAMLAGAHHLIPSGSSHTWSYHAIHVQGYRQPDQGGDPPGLRDTQALQTALAEITTRKGGSKNCKLLFEDRVWNFSGNRIDLESWEGLHLEGCGGSGYTAGVQFRWDTAPPDLDVTGTANNANGANGSLWTLTPNVSDSTLYSVTIKVVSNTGVVLFPAATASYTSGVLATAEQICEGLLAAINALTPVGFTAASLPSGSSSTYVQLLGNANAVVYVTGWNTTRINVQKTFSGIGTHLYIRSNDTVNFTSQTAGDTLTGYVTSYAGTSLTLLVLGVTGSGTGSNWNYVARSRRYLLSLRSTLSCAVHGIQFMAPDGYDGWILDAGHGRNTSADLDKGDTYQLSIRDCGLFGHDDNEALTNGALLAGCSSFEYKQNLHQNLGMGTFVQNCPGRLENCSYINIFDVGVQQSGFAVVLDSITFEPVTSGPYAGWAQAVRTLPGSLSCTLIGCYLGDSGPGSTGRWIDNRGGAALLLLGNFIQQDATDRAPIRMGGGNLCLIGNTFQCSLIADSDLADGYGYVESAFWGNNSYQGTKANIFRGNGFNADTCAYLGRPEHHIPRLHSTYVYFDQGGEFANTNLGLSAGVNHSGGVSLNTVLTTITGPVGAYSLSGAAYGGAAGQFVLVRSSVQQVATFTHQDATDPTAAYRFICPGGRDLTFDPRGGGHWMAMLISTGGGGHYVFPLTPTATYASPNNLAAANGTITLSLTTARESWKTCATPAANIATSIDASAARDGDTLIVTRYDTAPYTWTFTDLTSGDVTILPAGRPAWIEYQVFSGAAQLKRWS